MKSMALEFRVRWQREGRQPTTRIFQSWDAACRKARGVQALDDVKADTVRFAEMPGLVGPVELQVREVGAWRAHDHQPQATDYDRKGMRDWAEEYEPLNAADAGIPF